jgi:hypothetical protein
MTEAVKLIDVRRHIPAIVGIPGEIEAIDPGGVVVHSDGQVPFFGAKAGLGPGRARS